MKRIMVNCDEETEAYINQIKKSLQRMGLQPSDSQTIVFAINKGFYKLLDEGLIKHD